MTIRVLVVDDSGFFRRRLVEILSQHPLLEVVGQADDGREAVRLAAQLRPDVITMDVEMPQMDGIAAVREIMRHHPTPVLMLSSLTTQGAAATLDALNAGAVDFLPKQLEDLAPDRESAERLIRKRVVSLGLRQQPKVEAAAPPPPRVSGPMPSVESLRLEANRYRLLVIGASTGGPVALRNLLVELPARFPLPVLLIQHMPAAFTPTFAERLNDECALTVTEAQHGELLSPGHVYLAPGGRQLELHAEATGARIRISDPPPSTSYKPSVDVAFKSAAQAFPGAVMAVILTGMGADGREGARYLKQQACTLWAQDEASSVIYGMPRAVAEAGLADKVLSLSAITAGLRAMTA